MGRSRKASIRLDTPYEHRRRASDGEFIGWLRAMDGSEPVGHWTEFAWGNEPAVARAIEHRRETMREGAEQYAALPTGQTPGDWIKPRSDRRIRQQSPFTPRIADVVFD